MGMILRTGQVKSSTASRIVSYEHKIISCGLLQNQRVEHFEENSVEISEPQLHQILLVLLIHHLLQLSA